MNLDDRALPGLSVIRRVPELWIDDGNIVLQAEDVQFKVHRSILSMHSPVFAALLRSPPSDGAPMTVDGCPLIRLAQDSAVEVRHLLLALYGDNPFLKSQRPIAFEVVAAILRLGRKYQIASLRDQAYASLKKEIPVSLDDVSRAPRREIDFHFLAELINLALECDIQTVLPVAYFVTANNLKHLISGWVKPDGTKVMLSEGARATCILGRDRIIRDNRRHFDWIEPLGKDENCSNKMKCKEVADYLLKVICGDHVAAITRFLFSMEQFEKLYLSKVENSLCVTCTAKAKAGFLALREATWKKLPSYFELPPWEELQDFSLSVSRVDDAQPCV